MNDNMSFGLSDINGKTLQPKIKSNGRNSDTLIQFIVEAIKFSPIIPASNSPSFPWKNRIHINI